MSPRTSAGLDLPSDDRIIEAGLTTVREAISQIHKRVREDPKSSFDKIWNRRLCKYLLAIDLETETTARATLRRLLPDFLEIRGEESSLERVSDGRLTALLDILDGSDLLERDLGNWCSVLVLFSKDRIITAVTGIPSGEIYYTKAAENNYVFVVVPSAEKDPIIQRLRMEPREVPLRDAGVAFYGQKVANFLSPYKSLSFASQLEVLIADTEANKKTSKEPFFRIYNLGGIPMMLKLIEGRMDAIFDIRGQKCHDVVPGFILALKAGAVLKDVNTGRRIEEKDILDRLSEPENRFHYVMACCESLADELLNSFSKQSARSSS